MIARRAIWFIAPWSIALFTVAWPSAARAAGPAFEYDAPDGCPDEDAFRAGVLGRLGASELAQAGRIALTIAEDGDLFRGELVLHHPHAGADLVFGRRSLQTKDCEELVEAFVLVAALAWTEGTRPPPIPPPRPRRLALTAGTDVGAYQGVSVVVSPGAEVFVEARYVVRRFIEPAVRLHVAAAGANEVSGAGTARFVWITAGLDVCPARFSIARFSFSPCARLDVGALRAHGVANGAARDSAKAWVAPSVLGRFALRIARLVSIEADAALVIPLSTDRYFFPPDTTIFSIPRVAAAGRLGASIQFY